MDILLTKYSDSHAVVAELADAQDSGSCERKLVEVQVLSTAPIILSMTQTATAARNVAQPFSISKSRWIVSLFHWAHPGMEPTTKTNAKGQRWHRASEGWEVYQVQQSRWHGRNDMNLFTKDGEANAPVTATQ
jgi:hypothetical protein